MADLHEMAKPAVGLLFQSDVDQLYEELAIRSKAIEKDPSVAGSFSPDAAYDATLMGPMDDLRRFGKLFFERVSKQCYGLVCGPDAKDSAERQKVLDAFKIGKEEVSSALAALLVAYLGVAPALAAVLAVLVVKLFFRPAVDAMCQVWSEKLAK